MFLLWMKKYPAKAPSNFFKEIYFLNENFKKGYPPKATQIFKGKIFFSNGNCKRVILHLKPTHSPAPTKSSSSIFQCNFLEWSRKIFNAGSQKTRCLIVSTSKWYIPIINWFRNDHITVILAISFPVPYPDFRVWILVFCCPFVEMNTWLD